MNVNLRKLLATASCWLVILCGSRALVEAAEQVATVDGIVRSIVAVRTQLEPVLKYRLGQRTTPQPQMTRLGGLACGGAIRVPGLQRLFKCVPPAQAGPQPFAPIGPSFPTQARVNDGPKHHSPVEIISSDQKAAWTTYSDGTSSSIQSGTSPPYQDDELRSNPLGFIVPTREQINQFQQWQRPYQQRPSNPVTTTTTTTVRPQRVVDFYFPQSVEDRETPFGTVRPTQYYTTTVASVEPTSASIAGRLPLEPNGWSGLDSTNDPLEETATTEPPEEEHGLGNRIDHKLLLSLVG